MVDINVEKGVEKWIKSYPGLDLRTNYELSQDLLMLHLVYIGTDDLVDDRLEYYNSPKSHNYIKRHKFIEFLLQNTNTITIDILRSIVQQIIEKKQYKIMDTTDEESKKKTMSLDHNKLITLAFNQQILDVKASPETKEENKKKLETIINQSDQKDEEKIIFAKQLKTTANLEVGVVPTEKPEEKKSKKEEAKKKEEEEAKRKEEEAKRKEEEAKKKEEETKRKVIQPGITVTPKELERFYLAVDTNNAYSDITSTALRYFMRLNYTLTKEAETTKKIKNTTLLKQICDHGFTLEPNDIKDLRVRNVNKTERVINPEIPMYKSMEELFDSLEIHNE